MVPPSLRMRAIAVAALLVGGVLTASASAAAAPAPRTVTYHGYQVDVPAGWRVVDLAKQPETCVRFDVETVYLGRPGAQNDCPTRLVGRTASLVVEPLAGLPPEQVPEGVVTAPEGSAKPPKDATSHDGAIRLAVEDAGVLVTAAHNETTESAVRELLDTARLVPGGTPAALPATPLVAAASIVAPGTFEGKGFDACTAPPQASMNAWLASPYRSIGIYISGSFRGCSQPNLTASWVATQYSKGWQFVLTDVGRQAPCTSFSLKMSTDPATAKSQGVTAADAAVTAATALGFGSGSAIYSDIENYTSTASCKASVLSYVSGWTERLHAKGWLSGVYSSASSGIKDLSSAYSSTAYTRPDHIFFAWWNSAADTDTGSYVPAGQWASHQRIHQYVGENQETYGGVRINIDRDYLDVGTGNPVPCDSVSLDFSAYPSLSSGTTGNAVKAAQCLLATSGQLPAATNPSGSMDAATVAAVKAFQQSRSLLADGIVGAHTWTALLSTGDTPALSQGSTGTAVRRLQRSLTAALGTTVGIDGDFGPATETAVRSYQSSRGLGVDGQVGPATWGALKAGK
ncbi:glycoside hydrolase domain-containing protein [Actinophytocola oryzae]|uniref:Peptidoglycan hydrolase-like protein with peptidoglycan-binding domain n=1 Tax=Actinophytocola oryzae TaxID=502181 RepID=A0A4R7V5Q4_9PSEU|nr:glycoside hydrolase domain-containing protein [Actinophytocola oryzae]TDV44280.1 peptidoglycan hydrolase-like protein with peptidoglycan-binding domain [Actinophytocola oryzae]